MWKWIKHILRTYFGVTKKPLALAAKADNGIIVKLKDAKSVEVVKQDAEPEVVLSTLDAFKKNINKAHKQAGFTHQDLLNCVNKIITEEIPHEYKDAFKYSKQYIIITCHSFKGSYALLTRGFPIVAAELAKLGIYDVTNPVGTSIFVSVDSIAKAAEQWGAWGEKPKAKKLLPSEELVVEFNPSNKYKTKRK